VILVADITSCWSCISFFESPSHCLGILINNSFLLPIQTMMVSQNPSPTIAGLKRWIVGFDKISGVFEVIIVLVKILIVIVDFGFDIEIFIRNFVAALDISVKYNP
jgi:hypothetical protein